MEIQLRPAHEARLAEEAAGKVGTWPMSQVTRITSWLAELEWRSEARLKIEEGWRQSEAGEVVDGESARREMEARQERMLAQSRRE